MFLLFSFLFTLFSTLLAPVRNHASVGCLFSSQLCELDEFCFDDDAFGQCARHGPVASVSLDDRGLERLETELKRLYFFGFRWDQVYTQCIVKQLLRGGDDDEYQPKLCLSPASSSPHHKPAHSSSEGRQAEHAETRKFQPASVDFRPPFYSDYAIESFNRHSKQKKEEEEEEEAQVRRRNSGAPVAFRSPKHLRAMMLRGALQHDTSSGLERASRTDIKKPGPQFVTKKSKTRLSSSSSSTTRGGRGGDGRVTVVAADEEEGAEEGTITVDSTQTFVSFRQSTSANGERFVFILEQLLNLPRGTFSNIKAQETQVTFKVNPNPKGFNASTVASNIEKLRDLLHEESGLEIEAAGIGDEVNRIEIVREDNSLRTVTMVVSSVMLAVIALAIAALVYNDRRKRAKKGFGVKCGNGEVDGKHGGCGDGKEGCGVGEEGAVETLYQELCRQRMQSEGTRCTEELDINTGHLILQVMEDYSKNNGARLKREWISLSTYDAEDETHAAHENMGRNRFNDVLPFDHSRVVLKGSENAENNDYINASAIIDHDPRNPTYILTQGPLPNTLADFWQMVYEQSVVIIVNLTRLQENGVEQCGKYWPESGSLVYGTFEVHLVSEHIWSDDFLVRSFYLKNMKTLETRTVSQFHFLSWPADSLPPDPKAFLDFRRKVNKSFRGRCSPIVVHCSDGVGRSGTYCLIDMVLSRVLRGAKEIDLEATLEHIRDQRGGAVRTQAQYEFVLKCLADEIHSFLK